MLSRRHRFHGHNSVRRVYKDGRSVRTALAGIHVLRGERLRTSKIAIVVSRKVDKSAVRRNRIRRRLYEFCRKQEPNINPPAEVVITVYQSELGALPPERLEAELNELFKKAKLI
jgi:ribonuclease P protein component